MSRFFVPAVLTVAVSGLALTLIAIVIARSPYTHGNLASAAGYGRTHVALVGETQPFTGPGLKDPRLAHTGDPVQDGAALFVRFGCAGCHGLQGQGGPVGPNIASATVSKLTKKVRSGPKGMPEYSPDTLSDEQIQNIAAFLQSLQ